MGERGPTKKPTGLKLLQGIPGGEHKLNPDEPKPAPAHGAEPPASLTEDGREIWKSEAPKLEKLGLLTEVDLGAFARYCDMQAKWLKAKKFLDEKGFYYPIFWEQSPADIKAGKPKVLKYLCPFPEVSIYNQLGQQLSRLEKNFGMTPSARASLSVEGASGVKKKGIKAKLYAN